MYYKNYKGRFINILLIRNSAKTFKFFQKLKTVVLVITSAAGSEYLDLHIETHSTLFDSVGAVSLKQFAVF